MPTLPFGDGVYLRCLFLHVIQKKLANSWETMLPVEEKRVINVSSMRLGVQCGLFFLSPNLKHTASPGAI